MFGVAAIGMLFQQMLECMHVGANVAKLLVVGVGVAVKVGSGSLERTLESCLLLVVGAKVGHERCWSGGYWHVVARNAGMALACWEGMLSSGGCNFS